MRRTFTEVCKKQIAASQRWTCSSCEKLLDSTYQVDHTVPLWAGGMDSPSNATAMCVACHAVKTQNEAVRRAEVEREREEKKKEKNTRTGCGKKRKTNGLRGRTRTEPKSVKTVNPGTIRCFLTSAERFESDTKAG